MTKSDSSKSTKRKGTRSVSTLTPAQLARKRANDREAQRAIRARTKEHIENLEREIEELRSSHSRDETVRNLLRRNKALEDELHRTRESMGITSGGPRSMYPSGMMVSKGVYATRSHHDAAYHSPSSRSSPMAQGSSDYPSVHDIPPYDSMGSSGEPWSSTVSCTVPSTVSSPSSSGATDELGSAYFPTSAPTSLLDRSGIPSSMNSPTASCLNGKMGYDDMKSVRSRLHPNQCPPHAAGVPPASAVEHVPHVLPRLPGSVESSRHDSLHHWEIPVSVAPPTTHSDALLSGYIQDCRRLVNLAGGQPHPEIIYGPTCPNVRPLVEAHWSVESNMGLGRNPPHPSPPNPLVDLLSAFLDKNGLLRVLERVGSFVLCQRMVAWLIYPAQETHARLGFLAPRPSQQNIAHSQWIDFLFWGPLRDVVLHRQEYATEEFIQLYCTNLRLLNWHGGVAQAFITDHSNGALYLTDAFVHHALEIRNWALGEAFARRYPELREMVAMEPRDF
ncbi:uncharacterized protein PG998_002560 [Apiospora kogelbergensis]|uniref:uncharacterized protein n=1 Tax=Apiospora kogelbergensis TaxID=1337665 RepID=UPI00312F2770